MIPIYKVNTDFNIEELLNKKYGFEKRNDKQYVFLDLAVPIRINTETREVEFGGCTGIVPYLILVQMKKTLLEKKIIICETYDIKAKCIKESNKDYHWLEHDLELGKLYEVNDIRMGQIYTNIYLKEKEHPYDSVIFEFYEGDKQIDIYKDERFNPYMRNNKGE